jgi:hypothetical protein
MHYNETDLLNAFSDCLVFILAVFYSQPSIIHFFEQNKNHRTLGRLHCKKMFAVFPSPDGMSLAKLPLGK